MRYFLFVLAAPICYVNGARPSARRRDMRFRGLHGRPVASIDDESRRLPLRVDDDAATGRRHPRSGAGRR